MKLNGIAMLLRETWRGKSLGRILFNRTIARECEDLKGTVIDLGGGNHPSHERFWRVRPEKFIRVDRDAAHKPDVIADMNDPLPFGDNAADHVLLFSVIYILPDPEAVLRQIRRVLKPGGTAWIASPFVFAEAPEPHDYARYTQEGLLRMLEGAGFGAVRIIPVGERFSSAANLLTPFMPRMVRMPAYVLAAALDHCIPKKLRTAHPAPLGYFCVATK